MSFKCLSDCLSASFLRPLLGGCLDCVFWIGRWGSSDQWGEGGKCFKGTWLKVHGERSWASVNQLRLENSKKVEYFEKLGIGKSREEIDRVEASGSDQISRISIS